jgi:transcription termination factor Rho
MQDNSGFVRPNFNPNGKDAYIASMQIRRYGLRAGDMIVGAAKKTKEMKNIWAMTRIDKVNGMDLASALRRPDLKIWFLFIRKANEVGNRIGHLSTRILDLFCPVGLDNEVWWYHHLKQVKYFVKRNRSRSGY